MFRPTKVRRAKFPGLTERMVDDDGTSITLVGINLHRQWTLEYAGKADRLKFRFMAFRNEPEAIAVNPIVAPGEYWIVPFSYWLLATAMYADPGLGAESLAKKAKEKITTALLAWPLDADLNTVQAKDVQFRTPAKETAVEVQVAVANAKRQEKARRRRQWFRSIVALVVAFLLLRWLRSL